MKSLHAFNCQNLIATEQILFRNSVDFIGYPRQAYRGFLSLPKGFKMLRVLTSEVATVTSTASPLVLFLSSILVYVVLIMSLCQRNLI